MKFKISNVEIRLPGRWFELGPSADTLSMPRGSNELKIPKEQYTTTGRLEHISYQPFPSLNCVLPQGSHSIYETAPLISLGIARFPNNLSNDGTQRCFWLIKSTKTVCTHILRGPGGLLYI
jgi:hypothetical protein